MHHHAFVFGAATCALTFVINSAEAATGGPDAFGYTWADQASGAVYNYVDITTTGTQVQAFGDDVITNLTLAAPFSFYGAAFTNVRVSTNGFITELGATASDLSNSCPLPDADSTVHSRIELLHDDLETRIFYQYFDQAAAAGLGYPGETAGISVIQWTGDHFPDSPPDNVNFEVILFHDDNGILMMVASDPETGSGSTTGIYDPAQASSLTVACNVAGTLTPGVTAIRWVAPPIVCGDSIVAATEQCDEGGPTATCNADCTVPICGDGIVNVGEDCDDAGESATCDADCTLAACGDGQINSTAGEDCDDTGESATCDADCSAASCGDGVTNITAGEACDDAGESAACDADCTPATCGDAVTNAAAGEDCDDVGESVACDADCTAAACGDGTVNVTAGEQCDDMGRSVACNANCTITGCGDGVVNMTAGEQCDDAGESATCDADCSSASCGDGLLNASAGEECDDGGESALCNTDCTIGSCGDGTVNTTAGEECDDGNTAGGDGCDASCLTEGGEGGGGTGGGGTTSSGTTSSGTTSSGTTSSGTTGSGTGGSGTGGEGGDGTDETGDGCGCRTPSDPASDGRIGLVALLGLGLAMRRRRRA